MHHSLVSICNNNWLPIPKEWKSWKERKKNVVNSSSSRWTHYKNTPSTIVASSLCNNTQRSRWPSRTNNSPRWHLSTLGWCSILTVFMGDLEAINLPLAMECLLLPCLLPLPIPSPMVMDIHHQCLVPPLWRVPYWHRIRCHSMQTWCLPRNLNQSLNE